jgi:hypothetical protein
VDYTVEAALRASVLAPLADAVRDNIMTSVLAPPEGVQPAAFAIPVLDASNEAPAPLVDPTGQPAVQEGPPLAIAIAMDSLDSPDIAEDALNLPLEGTTDGGPTTTGTLAAPATQDHLYFHYVHSRNDRLWGLGQCACTLRDGTPCGPPPARFPP